MFTSHFFITSEHCHCPIELTLFTNVLYEIQVFNIVVNINTYSAILFF